MKRIEVKPRDEDASSRFLRLPTQMQSELISVHASIEVALAEMSFGCQPDLSEAGKPVIGCVDPRRILAQLLKARQAIERVTGFPRQSTIHGWDWPEPK